MAGAAMLLSSAIARLLCQVRPWSLDDMSCRRCWLASVQHGKSLLLCIVSAGAAVLLSQLDGVAPSLDGPV